MFIKQFQHLLQLGIFLLLASLTALGNPFPKEEITRFLLPQLGGFSASGALTAFDDRSGQLANVIAAGERTYRSDKAGRFSILVIDTKSDANAYSVFLTYARPLLNGTSTRIGAEVGIRSLVLPNQLLFFKGPTFVSVTSLDRGNHQSALLELSRQVAILVANGEGDIPVLVKHLPDWQNVESQLTYAVDIDRVKSTLPNQHVLEATSFEGGAEAVVAPYGPAQMLLIEFTTPQLATENDQHIQEKIQELKSTGQPVPTAYRRVGNYSVFVFNAASEQSANQLIDQIKYEQVVQWLGDNPYWLKQAQKEYTETTLGVFVTVVKTSGMAAVLCFGIGGFLGALLFARRRARQINTDAYSDAGGMMRLNLDELTAETDPGKLIGTPNKS